MSVGERIERKDTKPHAGLSGKLLRYLQQCGRRKDERRRVSGECRYPTLVFEQRNWHHRNAVREIKLGAIAQELERQIKCVMDAARKVEREPKRFEGWHHLAVEAMRLRDGVRIRPVHERDGGIRNMYVRRIKQDQVPRLVDHGHTSISCRCKTIIAVVAHRLRAARPTK